MNYEDNTRKTQRKTIKSDWLTAIEMSKKDNWIIKKTGLSYLSIIDVSIIIVINEQEKKISTKRRKKHLNI